MPPRPRHRTQPPRRRRIRATETPRGLSYRSHFVLFPQGTKKEWYDAFWPYFEAFRTTRGESYDDAAKVHGDLGHTITAINVPDEAIEYMRSVNPDAEFDRIAAETPEALNAIALRRVREGRRFGPDEPPGPISPGRPEERPSSEPGYPIAPSSTPHKLGFYVHVPRFAVELAVRVVKPRVILAHAQDTSFWAKVRQVSPDSVIIGREYVPPGDQQNFMNNPEQVGHDFAERLLNHEISRSRVDGRSLFDAWMSFNEAIPGPQPYGSEPSAEDIERFTRYDRFQVAFATRLREGGFEPVAMNFATMNWAHGRDWLNYFKGTLETYNLLGFHEYGWPNMQGIGGKTGCLDYRKIMRDVRSVYGNKHTAVITECGLARLALTGSGGDVGYRVDPLITFADYWASLRWYNEELMRDDYVLGCCLYQVGHGPNWETFELAGTPIIDWIASLGS
ncbi:MAG: hypothetical protein M5U01_25255 [Ardenticatenaceae bacterium]|nr:hypothetical protein [Ardenticatenaceae bacterium]HBY93423.1 hypothetical protein [Chloroflexota bacterium]